MKQTIKDKIITFCFFAFFLISICGIVFYFVEKDKRNSETVVSTQRITWVTDIWWHKHGEYTIDSQDPGTTVIKSCYINARWAMRYTDVPTTQPIYVDVTRYKSGAPALWIHMHSNSIKGAGWQTGGKHPESGSTVKINE
jgi:hypothetical protein